MPLFPRHKLLSLGDSAAPYPAGSGTLPMCRVCTVDLVSNLRLGRHDQTAVMMF